MKKTILLSVFSVVRPAAVLVVLMLASDTVILPVAADEPIAEAATSIDKAEEPKPVLSRPSLAELMQHFAAHEARYFPFQLTSRETYSWADRTAVEDEWWSDGETHERLIVAAQSEPSVWHLTESVFSDGKLKQTVEYIGKADEVHYTLKDGSPSSTVPIAAIPRQFLVPRPLMGIFPLKLGSLPGSSLLSAFYKQDPSRVKLSWDGDRALLVFRIKSGKSATRSFKLWLEPEHGWHPVQMEMHDDVNRIGFSTRWQAINFYRASNGSRIINGEVQYPGKRPIAYTVGFKVQEWGYNEILDSDLFEVDLDKVTGSMVLQTETSAAETTNSGNEESKRIPAGDAAERRVLQQAYRISENTSQKTAASYRAEAEKQDADTEKLDRLKEQLNGDVARVFNAMTALQEYRLNQAERNLQSVREKQRRRKALASKIIEHRVREMLAIDGEFLWDVNNSDPFKVSATTATTTTVSPQAAVQVPDFESTEDLLRYFDLACENEEYEKYVAVLTDEEANRLAGMMLSLASMMREAFASAIGADISKDDAGEKNLEAYSEITELLKSHVRSAPPRAAKESLQSVMQYSLEAALEIDTSAGISANRCSLLWRSAAGMLSRPREFASKMLRPVRILTEQQFGFLFPWTPSDWITISSSENFSLAVNMGRPALIDEKPLRMSLAMRNLKGQWRISQLVTDETITSLLLGTHGVSTMPEVAGAISDVSPAQKALNAVLAEKIQTVWLQYAHLSSPYDLADRAIFDAQRPPWFGEYLALLEERLSQKKPSQWSMEELRLVRSIADAAFFQTVDSKHDMQPIGRLLEQFIHHHITDQAKHADAVVRAQAYSAPILALALHLNGRLPKGVMAFNVVEEPVARKLELLKLMAENGANTRWIYQERPRLSGLLEEAPIQVISELLQSSTVSETELMITWMYGMLSTQYSDNTILPPPIDVALFVWICERMVGKDAETDDRLALCFVDPESHRSMLNRSLNQLLGSEVVYRETVLQSLISIYRDSKSAVLKERVANVAPAVPALAK